jgi:hypothetical protein
MQNPNNALDDFDLLMSMIDEICNKLGLNRKDYTTHTQLFVDVYQRLSLETLLHVNEMLGDAYLDDDFLGDAHRLVRARIQELSPNIKEGEVVIGRV